MQPPQLRALDAWIAEQSPPFPSRPEAVRQLVEIGQENDLTSTDAREAFALHLEAACSEFEILREILDRQIRLVGPELGAQHPSTRAHLVSNARISRAIATIRMALAKSFVFNANRANRICFKNKSVLSLDRDERERFLKATGHLSSVRDVIEHGFDGDKRSEKNRPSMHEQNGGRLDETSLNIAGSDKVFIGTLNLYDIYLAVDRMRAIAGFAALPDERPR